MYRTLLVALGGLVGSIGRYWLSGWAQNLGGSDFPVGTLTVNILGSFILGLVMTMSIERGLISPETRLLLGTGFCGGFTTMSTFSYETVALLQYGNTVSALTNIGLSLASCVIAVWVGSIAGRVL